MKFDCINKNNNLISVTLCGISVVFVVLICLKTISYFKLSAKVRNIGDMVQTIQARDCNNQDELDKYLSPTREMANNLKQNNLFAPPQPKKNPVTQVGMILGDEAWINNKWYKEGDKVQDANIVSIEPTQVTIEWNGKTKVFQPLGADIASNGSRGSSENAPPIPENIITSGPEVVTFAPPWQEQPPDEIPAPGVFKSFSQEQIPDEIKNVMEQRNLPNISPEMLQNLSEEQKEKLEEFEKAVRMQMQGN